MMISEEPKLETVKISEIYSQHIGNVYAFDTRIIKMKNEQDWLSVAHFTCLVCGAEMDVEQETGHKLIRPSLCNVDGCKNSRKRDFELILRKSKFRDFRVIWVQDAEDNTRFPKEVELWDEMALMNLSIGDRVKITGAVKTRQIKNLNLFNLYVDAVNLEVIESKDNDLNEKML